MCDPGHGAACCPAGWRLQTNRQLSDQVSPVNTDNHLQGFAIRAGNEPSQRLKFHNHGERGLKEVERVHLDTDTNVIRDE